MELNDALDEYRGLVKSYHRTLDLMSDAALRRLPELADEARLYADCIAGVAPEGTVLDVGSGVGLPGIVIAAALPHRTMLLVERRRRRATFLRIVVSKLGLVNAHVLEDDVRDVGLAAVDDVARRGERQRPTLSQEPSSDAAAGSGSSVGGVAVVTAQAVARLDEVYCLTRHLHRERIVLMSRKGPHWRDEVRALDARADAGAAVRAARDLGGGGTLLAIEARGGLPCPRSA